MDPSRQRELEVGTPNVLSWARSEAHASEVARAHAVYYDSEDRRLTRWNASLRFERPDEWVLVLPPFDGGNEPEPLFRFRGRAGAVPESALDLATAYLRGRHPQPIAEVLTFGGALPLRTADAEPELALPELSPTAPAGAFCRAALVASVRQLVWADPGLRLGTDTEALHRARVAVRRLRSDLRSFRSVLDDRWARALRRRARWLSDGLAAARDADVLLQRIGGQLDELPDVDARKRDLVVQLLRNVRDAAYRRLLSMLREPRYAALLDDLIGAAHEPRWSARAGEPADVLAAEVMGDAWRSLRGTVRRRSDPPTDAELHAIRIQSKRVRYASEALIPVCGKRARRFARRVARLQAILGEQHDAVVAREQLRQHLGGGDGAFVAGEVATLEAVAAQRARRRWLRAWRAVRREDGRFWR